MNRILGRLYREERGEFLASMLVFIVGILMVIGFTVDAGRLLAARRALNDTASQAAVAGVQHVDGQALITGNIDIGPDGITAANSYLTATGTTGTATINGDTVIVETTGTFSPIMFFGLGSKNLTGHGTARAVRGVDTAES